MSRLLVTTKIGRHTIRLLGDHPWRIHLGQSQEQARPRLIFVFHNRGNQENERHHLNYMFLFIYIHNSIIVHDYARLHTPPLSQMVSSPSDIIWHQWNFQKKIDFNTCKHKIILMYVHPLHLKWRPRHFKLYFNYTSVHLLCIVFIYYIFIYYIFTMRVYLVYTLSTFGDLVTIRGSLVFISSNNLEHSLINTFRHLLKCVVFN